MTTFESYQSPFSWRYGSPEMRAIWGEENKRLVWRRLWVAMAEAQVEWGLATSEQVEDLKAHMKDVDVAQALEIEKSIHHDLMAEIKVYAGQCPTGGSILHLGATSMDIKDNTEVLQIAQSLDLLIPKLEEVLSALADKMEQYAALPVIGFTHLQPAEPTTLGYRLAGIGQDFFEDHSTLIQIRQDLKGKGFKGAVGNAAANVMLFEEDGQARFEEQVSQTLRLPFFPISSQTYTRKQDYIVISALASFAATAHKFAFDLRLLQSEVIGELAEPFGSEQVGSSAMPFKRNPVDSEKIDSLARALSVAPLTAWNNYANSLLERTLDDSANRRTLFPESFLAADEILTTLGKIIRGLVVNRKMIAKNLGKFGPFAALERVMAAAVKNGADRQNIHEALRQLSMAAWQSVQDGKPNPLAGLVAQDERITVWIAPDELVCLFDLDGYTGIARSRACEMAGRIRTGVMPQDKDAAG